MDKIPKGLVSEYRWYRSHSQTVSALVLADRIAELLERSGDRETLAEMKAKLVGGFYTGDPEARNSALGEFTRLALDESGTWTFYKFATAKGYVTVRWLGESNGYYGEDVSFCDVTPGARECTDCGGSGYGPDRCDGPGDVSQDKCDRCGGRGLEPEASHA